ncbi:MAG: putative bifunctional diguanylate cyclase/phosphodiesterase, partial [bacterium]
FLDLDGFKSVNDTLGHSAGDHLLQCVAQRLKKNIRESDSIARLGGDEFTIILDHITHMQDAAKVAQKIIKVFSKPFIIEEQELYVTCSIGISLYPFDGVDIKTLVKKADIAMYRSKGQGKNKYQFYNASMDVMIFESMSLENGLKVALDKNELVLHYQPQVKIDTGMIVGVEALVRWQHPEFGLVYPAKFIPIAEETGLITLLGDWVLRTACAQIKVWQDELFPAMRLAVNVSSRQFRRKKLPETVALVLEENNLKPDSLQLEITESKAIQNVENTIAALQLFKEIGVQLSFDDFGNGYTSLGYLKRFPIDILKIDPSFVHGIPFDNDDAAIITAIIVLAHSMGLKVIAEGVETKDQLGYLRSLQCDEMQGFYFSQPIPADSLKKLLHSNGS